MRTQLQLRDLMSVEDACNFAACVISEAHPSSLYCAVIADEIQDFKPDMLKLLRAHELDVSTLKTPSKGTSSSLATHLREARRVFEFRHSDSRALEDATCQLPYDGRNPQDRRIGLRAGRSTTWRAERPRKRATRRFVTGRLRKSLWQTPSTRNG